MNETAPNIKGSFQILYRTIKGNSYPLEIGYAVLPSQYIPIDREATTAACIRGCKLYGRNGGCPPFSPMFSEICGKEVLVFYAKLKTRFYPYRVLYGSYYTRWVFVETFMTAFTNRVGKRVANTLDGYFISSGHCAICRPKRCAVKDGGKCRNPSERTYSLEATGVLVTKLMEDCFDTKLQWWRKEEPCFIPSFMVKVVGITMDKAYSSEVTLEAMLEAVKKDRAIIHDDSIES